jgi:hypothetical protein
MKRKFTDRIPRCRNRGVLIYGWNHVVYGRVFSTVVRHEKEMLKCLDLNKNGLIIGECSRRRMR